MRATALAVLTSLGLLTSESALAGKSFAGTVGKAVPSGAQASAPAHRGYHHHHRTLTRMRTAVFAAFIMALAGVVASEPAFAHGRSRVTVGVGVGFGYPYWASPFWGPWYYPPPVYYPVPVVVSPPPPVTYVEQANPGNWWYYCETAKGYYPYVKECPTGWQRVSPTPPGSR